MADLIFSKSEDLFPARVELFRPIYYLGCKTSLTSAIKRAIDEVDPSGGRLLDLFAGTGAVAAAMADSRRVGTVDVQEYSRVICSALLNPANISADYINRFLDAVRHDQNLKSLNWCIQPLRDYERASIDDALVGNPAGLIELLESPPLVAYENSDAPLPDSRLGQAVESSITRMRAEGLDGVAHTTVSRNFGGVYFSFDQAIVLDVVLSMAADAESSMRDTLKASALSTASTLVNTIGKQFAQPIQPRNRAGVIKPGLAARVHRDRSIDAISTERIWLGKYANLPTRPTRSEVFRLDYVAALEQYGRAFSVVYADPPYTRDHYSRFYHVLETMCLRDNPTVSKVTKNGKSVISRGVYREDRHQSPFCIRSSAPKAFEALFSVAHKYNLPLVLSYSPHEDGDGTHPRSISMEQLVGLAGQYYSRVDVCGVDGITHNRLNRTGLTLKARDQAEVIIKCFR